MSDGAAEWKDRWKVSITCRDCGASWECKGVSVSLQKLEGFNRMFVAGGPEVCPACKNLKAVPDEQEHIDTIPAPEPSPIPPKRRA